MSMTLATTWVRRGVAAEFPQKYEIDEAELGRIEKLAKLQIADAKEDLDAAQRGTETSDSDSDAGAPTTQNGTTRTTDGDTTDDLEEYNMSDYDNDQVDTDTGEAFNMVGDVRSLAYHQVGEEDPYLMLPAEDDSDNEREDLQVLATDNLVLAARVEDEVPHLEVFVYEDDADNIYVHHDVMLPAIPLCLEWLDTSGTKTQGNFVAVGMMQPEIEVWDLDIVDSMYPTAILGQQPEQKEKKKKKKRKLKPNDEFHVDAVLTLSLNKHHRNLLASGSADTTIKLWDLNTGLCAKSYIKHAGKVASLDWHPDQTKSTVLLSGSTDDRTVVMSDMQAPDAPASQWIVDADVERVRWDPHDSNFFHVTTEAGTVYYFDSRTAPGTTEKPSKGVSKAVWILAAHDGAVSSFDVNPIIPGFLVTGSDDKKVKLWNVQNNKPTMVVSRNLDVGRVFSAQFAPDEEVAFRLCVAGSKGSVQVWDTSTNAAVRKVFAGRVKMPEGDVKERVLGVDEQDDSESEDDQEEEADGAKDGWESMEED